MFRPNPDNKTELKQVAGITVFLLKLNYPSVHLSGLKVKDCLYE
jgi:hypothetical protein